MSKTGQKLYEGLVFDAINYLGSKLNFSYTAITPEVTRNSNSWNTSRYAKLGEVRIYTHTLFFVPRLLRRLNASVLRKLKK